MHPILIDKPFGIDFITIHTFGLVVVIAFLTGSWLAGRLAAQSGLDKEQIANLALYLLLVGIVGARLAYVAVNFDQFRHAPWTRIFQIWEGGIVWYGGMLAATLFAFLWLRRAKIPLWPAVDALIVGTFFGLGFARWGCFFAGCCYGAECSAPWGVSFSDPRSVVGQEYEQLGRSLPTPSLHPTQIYSSIAAFAIAAILVRMHARKRFEGQVFATGLVIYPVGRFIIEIFRADRTRGSILGLLSASQELSVLVLVIGVTVYLLRARAARAATPAPAT